MRNFALLTCAMLGFASPTFAQPVEMFFGGAGGQIGAYGGGALCGPACAVIGAGAGGVGGYYVPKYAPLYLRSRPPMQYYYRGPVNMWSPMHRWVPPKRRW